MEGEEREKREERREEAKPASMNRQIEGLNPGYSRRNGSAGGIENRRDRKAGTVAREERDKGCYSEAN